jgi:hypothetical protein
MSSENRELITVKSKVINTLCTVAVAEECTPKMLISDENI